MPEKRAHLVAKRILDVLLWLTAIVYASGGVRYHGKLRLTYIQDFWTVCGACYVAFRLLFGVRFRETHFGRTALDVLRRFTDAGFKGKWKSLRGLSWPGWFLAGSLVYSLVLFFLLPLMSFWSGVAVWDTGIISNSIYSASRTGHFYTYYLSDGIHPLSYVPNNHLNLGLWIFAIIYKVIPRTEVVLLCQSLALLSGVFPLYKLGKRVLPPEMPDWYPVVIYLCWDSLYWLNIWDIHEAPFFIPLALWAFYWIELGSIGLGFLFMVLMAIWREDAWWTFAAMSLYVGFRTRKWGIAIPGFLVGSLLFPLHVAYFNRVNTLGVSYPYLGRNFHEAIHTLLHDPWVLARAAWHNANFFRELLLRTGGGAFLFSGAALIPVVPGIGEAGLSGGMYHWTDHYVGNFLAPVMVATLYGWKTVRAILARYLPKIPFELVWKFSLVLAFTQLGYSLTGGFRQSLGRANDRACVKELVSMVPSGAPLITSQNLGGPFANRLWIEYPDPNADETRAQWLVSDDRADLSAGMTLPHSTLIRARPWRIVGGCEKYYVARRAGP